MSANKNATDLSFKTSCSWIEIVSLTE